MQAQDHPAQNSWEWFHITLMSQSSIEGAEGEGRRPVGLAANGDFIPRSFSIALQQERINCRTDRQLLVNHIASLHITYQNNPVLTKTLGISSDDVWDSDDSCSCQSHLNTSQLDMLGRWNTSPYSPAH